MAGPDSVGGDALQWAVRAHIYKHFAETAAAPGAQTTADELGVTIDEVLAARRRLADVHALALMPESGDIWMAHPFAALPTPYRVTTPSQMWWANCAWDALAIPTMLDINGRIDATCPDCGYAFDITVEDGVLAGDDGVVQFVVPPSQFWEDIGFT